MASALLITLREGLEAALILSIVFAYLVRMQRRDQFRNVWLGAAAAIGVSLVAGAIIFLSFGQLSGRAEAIFEGMAMFLAVAVLSYMVIWMKRQARTIKTHLEAQVRSALEVGSALAMISLAFIVVVREGIETALFLFGAAQTATPAATALGGIAGLVIAVAIGYTGYRGSRRLNLSLFFNITGVLIVLFAAGLLAYGIHELQEAGLFPIVTENVWDINHVLNENAGVGSFLKALFGYNGNPALLEVVFYFGYLTLALWFFFAPQRLLPQPPRPPLPSPKQPGAWRSEGKAGEME